MRMSMTKNKSSVEFEVVAHQYVKEREYWLTNLSGELVKSGIAYDHKESPGKSVEAAVRFQLPGNVSSKLIKLSSGVDEVLHMALTAAVVLLLNKYTGNSDIIVGTPIYKEDVKREFINTVLALRNQLEEDMTFKDLLLRVRQTILNAIEHQNYPIEIVLEQLKLPVSTEDFPLFEIAVLLGNIHDESYIRHIHLPVIFFFMRTRANDSNDIDIEGSVKYDPTLYGQETIERVVNHLILLLGTVLSHTDMPLSAVEILSEEEKKQLLYDFNNTEIAYPRGKTISQLFEEQVEKIPDNIALRYKDQSITYKELDEKSNQLANYLCFEKEVRIDEPVGLLMDRSLDMIVSILGILKAGGAYVPIDSSFPEERMKIVIHDADIGVFISQKRYIKTLNRLQWECTGFHTYLCLDSEDIYAEEEVEKSELMGKKLWEYVGETATDEITGGGWLSSYTGEPIPAEEMDEYGDNILKKLIPLLHPEMRILEIGCASGISMYRIAPKVGLYYGTDLSSVIIRKNQERIQAEGHQNIVLSCVPAHEIDTIPENNFDLVIINSVIQCFHGHNYLRKVIHKAIDKLGDNGYLFIGDVMNQDLKAALIQDLVSFEQAHSHSEGKEKDYKTKTDWSTELFVSPAFFEDLMLDIPEIRSVEFSDKIYTIENELTKYRYDALIFVDKDKSEPVSNNSFIRHKYQHDVRTLRNYSAVPVDLGLKAGNLAYIIYTSGSTGHPKGVMVTHQNAVRLVKNTNYVELGEETRILQTGAPVFDATTFEIWGSILNGGELVLVGKEVILDAHRLGEALKEYRINTLWLSAPLFNQLMQQNIELFEPLNYLLVGGDVLSPPHINLVRQRFPGLKVINGYGPTENTTFSTTYLIDKEFEQSIPIGAPITNSTAYIVDRENHLQPVGICGELVVGGDGVAAGYLNNPQLTHEKFMNNPFVEGGRLYRTGDLVRWIPSGDIEFIGRMDNQVKIRGFRIELEEIENRLLEHPDIKDTAVVVRDDGSGDNFLCAYIVPRSSAAPDVSETFSVSELASYLEKELPDFMIPSHFVELPGLPLTVNGKIDRKALPEPDAAVPEDYVGPGNPVQEQLTTIWSDVLNIEKNRISIDSNFFEIGGHSLKATVLMSKIHKEMNVKVQLAEIFKFPTIRQLAAHVESINQKQEHEQKRFISIEPVEKREYYDLSPAQKRLYILQQMEAVYNMTAAWELKGVLNRRQLEETVNQLTHRHESLRTSFGMVNDVPFQKIHDRVDFKVEYYDLSKVEVEVKVEVEEGKSIPHAYASCSMLPAGIIESFIRPFDLTQVPLIRVGLIKIEEEHHILVLDMHHIISDGTSLGIFIKEFMGVYSGRVFPALRLQYKDYSRWHKSECEGEVIKKQEDYWLQQFDTQIPILNLPYDYPRPAVQSYEGGTLNFQLGKEEMEDLKGFAAGEDAVATMYMVLLALFNVLLAKLSGNRDITVGTPIAGRRHIDLQPIIGMFVGTLALRNYPDPSRTFFAFLQEVKEQTLTAFENQDYQFEDLVEHVVVNRDPGRNPLFDVMFALQNMEVQEMEISGLKVGLYDFENKIANFDLFLQGFEKEDGVIFLFTYCTKLFKKETVERFISYFKTIMSVLIKNPHKKISEIEIISAEEKQQILVDFNNTWKDYPQDKTIHRLFEEQVERAGHNIALVGSPYRVGTNGRFIASGTCTPHLHITYRELNQKSNELAFLLRDRGVKSDTIVGIMVEHSMEMEIGVLGILKAGGAYLPIDPDYPEERIRYMLTDSAVQILLTSRDNIPVGTGGLAPLYLPIEDRLAANSEKQPATSPENLAYIIYTSGSTGKPKGVGVEHGSAVNVLAALFNRYPITETDVYLLKTSFVFDVSVTELFGWFWGGCRMVILGRGEHKDPIAIINAIETSAVTHINFVPAMFNAFVEVLNKENIGKLSSLKYIFLAGEALVPELVNKFRRLGINVPLENLYGPTEGTVYASGYSLDQWEGRGNIPIGNPLQNMALYILGRGDYLQPVGVCGELCIAGAGVARGYSNNPEFTAERFPLIQDNIQEGTVGLAPLVGASHSNSKLYRTGDLCRWLTDGNIEFFGRIDRQVKIRGFRIELGEIENRLLTHESVKEAVVLDREDKNGDKYLYAYIVTLDADIVVDEGVTAFEKMPKTRNTELKEYLSQTLPDYMIPSFFVLMDRIPLTPSGKIDRRTLPKPEVEFDVEYAAPQNHIEKKLAEIWAEILEIDKHGISIDASFFDLGGHSLKATIMISRIKKILNATIPLAKVFKTPSIREIAKHVTPVDKAQCFSIESVEEREFYPLSPMQNRFFILNQLQTLKTAYNLPSVLTMEGKLNRKKFEKAFQQLIRRHDSLRTSFMLIDDEPRQRIHKEADFEIKDYIPEGAGGLAPLSVGKPDIKGIINNFVRPFDLSRAPLLRVELIKVEEEKHILMFDMHHIISDGTSLGILIKDIVSLYDMEALLPLPLQYKDFSQWLYSLEGRETIAQQEAYWLDQFNGPLPVLNMYTDYPRPPIQSFKGDTIHFFMGKELSQKIRRLIAQAGATLYMVLLAVLNILLSRYSGQEDIVVGTPIAGRENADFEGVIALFINALSIRNYPRKDKTFSQFLTEVKENTINAYENQGYPFETLMEKLKVEKDLSRNPLFDVELVVLNMETPALEAEGLTFTPYRHESEVSQVDIAFYILEFEEEIKVNLMYSTDLFKRETMEGFIAFFRDILSTAADNQEIKLEEIKMSHDLAAAGSTVILDDGDDFGF